MQQYKVTFLPYDRTVEVPEGESLIRAALSGGMHINASCGGEGVCGKCRVLVEKGNVSGGVTERLSEEDLKKNYRLACLAKISEDVTVRIPVESSIDRSVFDTRVSPRRTAKIQHPDFDSLKEQGLFIPPVEKIYLELPAPDAQNRMPDVTRLIEYLKLENDEHKLELPIPVIRRIPGILRENDFKVTVTLVRPVRDDGKTQITNIQPGDTTAENYAIALDIGTTTIYGQLIDLASGESLAEAGDFNGQISYGEDVISRIIYAEKPGGLEKLQEIVVGTINKVLGRILKAAGVGRENISTITLAGNTTMTQLLMAIDPRYLRRSPYVPASTLYPPFRASTIGLDLEDHVIALLYPAISSYVGGGILSLA